jgi:hypothetical protein
MMSTCSASTEGTLVVLKIVILRGVAVEGNLGWSPKREAVSRFSLQNQ